MRDGPDDRFAPTGMSVPSQSRGGWDLIRLFQTPSSAIRRERKGFQFVGVDDQPAFDYRHLTVDENVPDRITYQGAALGLRELR